MNPAEILRHQAPIQNHQDRRAAFRAADFLEWAVNAGHLSFEDAPAVVLRDCDLLIESVYGMSQPVYERARGVKVTHKPTGLRVERTVLPSRLKNLEAAMASLRAKVADHYAQQRP